MNGKLLLSQGSYTDMPQTDSDHSDFTTQLDIQNVQNDIYPPHQLLEMIENLLLKRDFALLSEILLYLQKKFYNNTEIRLFVLYYLSRKEIIQKNIANALNLIERGISELLQQSVKTLNLKHLLHLFYIEKYHCYFLNGNYEDGLNYYQDIVSNDYQDFLEKTKLRILLLIGGIYMEQGRYSLCMETYNEALSIAQDSEFSNYLPVIINQIGSVHQAMNKSEVSIETFKISLNFSEKVKNYYYICKNLIDIGLVLHFQDQLRVDEYFQIKYQNYERTLRENDVFYNIINAIWFNDYKNQEMILKNFLESKNYQNVEIKYIFIMNELFIEKILKRLQIEMSKEVFDELFDKLLLMEKLAEKYSSISTIFKINLLKIKHFLISGLFQDSLTILNDFISKSKDLSLPNYTKLFEIEKQKTQMNSLLFGKVRLNNGLDSEFSKQHLNELIYYFYNFYYSLNKYN
ncbi:MAG: hypothetical protein HeimC3_36850 [Candidatus Heimdallarchaeota archaeon LC_3]|nr:MAG: hypothetical protein HeimC3_36850 [Candidatus Heimdallarchaeota archaeon LC_3]